MDKRYPKFYPLSSPITRAHNSTKKTVHSLQSIETNKNPLTPTMAKAPKQWQLDNSTEKVTITRFEAWKNNMIYVLSMDSNFSPFLLDAATWERAGPNNPTRGLEDDVEPIPEARRKTAATKVLQLNLMLGQIANYATKITRGSITTNTTSVSDVWQKLRAHYGFQLTGARFLDLCDMSYNTEDSHEDYFQQLQAFFEDNLLQRNSPVKHHNADVETDEVMTPTLENVVCALWLKSIHPGLPNLVKQKYGSQLRNQTLASLKPDISLALQSLLDELQHVEESKTYRLSGYSQFRRGNNTSTKSCVVCKEAGRRYNNHTIGECRFRQERDRPNRRMGRTRAVPDNEYEDEDLYESDPYVDNTSDVPHGMMDGHIIRSVDIIQSPYFNAYYNTECIRLTLDTGATTSLIRSSTANRLGIRIHPSTQTARMADGVSSMKVVGEIHCQLKRGAHNLQLDALAVDKLDTDVLAGTNFVTKNDIGIRLAKRQIIIKGSDVINYNQGRATVSSIRRAQSFVLRGPDNKSVLLPGEYIDLIAPCEKDEIWALEPRTDAPVNSKSDIKEAWPPPQLVHSVDGSVRVVNSTNNIIALQRHEHFGQLRPIVPVDPNATMSVTYAIPKNTSSDNYSEDIKLDPDNLLPKSVKDQFKQLHHTYNMVFNPAISKYNGKSGDIKATVNMGPTMPPQRKGRLPQYNRNRLTELQAKFDELEKAGVFAKPEEVGVYVEYLNISFLINKPSGGTRLVTSFGEVASYSKPQPSLMPNVDTVLRDLARWQYIVVSDLHHAFYQVPLAHSSMKFCGVATPYKGIRVYTRSAMGMPGSETCLEELMSRVLGHLVEEGCVAKLADDLYCGGNSPEEALHNWSRVLEALNANNLRLSATKTTICPKTTNILGWVWSQGTLSASPHKLSALSTVVPPTTVQGLRSFIGAYKVLSRVIKGYADLLHPLDTINAGKASKDKIIWTDALISAFKKAQSALQHCETITLPAPEDTLWIVTDASVKNKGLSAVLYCRRDGVLKLGGFFNAKAKKHQASWLPCELEALCIGAAINHFAPYLIQSDHQGQVLTDSRPCVQACGKLQRGEFSTSARVSTFLSAISRYQLNIRHISGAVNLPADFTSRNPTPCTDPSSCQVCKFVSDLQQSVVIQSLSAHDVATGTATMPFTNRPAWLATQQECPDMRRCCAHLQQGTRPNKKAAKVHEVKRYLGVLTIAHDGLLVVRETIPFGATQDRIAVPRAVLNGLLTALHIKFSHPSKYQLKQAFSRYFYALDLDKSVSSVCDSCHHCNSLKYVPPPLRPQTSEPPPDTLGTSFAADVMKRCGQLILVLRETVSSYTLATILQSERHTDLRDGLLMLASQVRSLGDSGIHIRVDAAPGLVALRQDTMLQKYGISLIYGAVKNRNKNPVAERAIQELATECLHVQPEGGPLTKLAIALATAQLNERIRHGGLSAREMWTQRDQVTGSQLPFKDDVHIILQQQARAQNHPCSETAKLQGRAPSSPNNPKVGDLIYLKQERSKTKPRDKYIITAIHDDRTNCSVRKFTKDQLRARLYDVLLCECYPVMPNIPARQHIGHQSQSSSDEDLPVPPKMVPAHERPDIPAHEQPDIPNAINLPLDQPEPQHDEEVGLPEPPVPPDIEPPGDMEVVHGPDQNNLPADPGPLRRSSRGTKPNRWYDKNTWLLDANTDSD